MVAHEEEARRKNEIQEKRERRDEEDSTDVTGEGQERPGRDPHTYRSCLDLPRISYICVWVSSLSCFIPPLLFSGLVSVWFCLV